MLRIITSDDPRAAAYDPPEPVPCEFCGKPRYTEGFVRKDGIFWIPKGPKPCTCKEAQAVQAAKAKAKAEEEAAEEAKRRSDLKRARIAKIIGSSGLGKRFLNRRFDNFEVSEGTAAGFNTAQGYADNFALLQKDPTSQEKNGLMFTGLKGTGKTHLAAAIANRLMAEGVPVIFATMIDLLDKIKESFDRSSTTSEDAVLNLYKTADLLIIDDIGKEQPTEWALAKMYQIINARYEDYKPIIITSNYSPEELTERMTPRGGDRKTAEATIDRILEMTYIVPLAGESWRTKK